MMNPYLIVMIALMAISAFFIMLGVFGLHRFPDVYTRLHAATKCTTFGSIFLALAVMGYGVVTYTTEGDPDNQKAYIVLVAHTFLALLALLITNPTGAHAIARAARRSGVEPEEAVIDEFEEVN